MKNNLYYIHLISIEDMEILEITRQSTSLEYLIREANTVAKCYNTHGYSIDKIKIFNSNKELLISYNL